MTSAPILTPVLAEIFVRVKDAVPTPSETIVISCDDASALLEAITTQVEKIAHLREYVSDLKGSIEKYRERIAALEDRLSWDSE
ncbi:MAG: hypothetical protein AB9900_10835 [Humidesulfovibrio sp.]